MKHIFVIATALILILCASCGHNVGMVGVGTGFRVGGGEYGVSYGDGLFGTFVARDGVFFKAELDSTEGFAFDPSSNTYKGIKSVEYSVAPQVNGYAVDFARENPEVAKAYYEAMIKYYETQKSIVVTQPPLISEEKSKTATLSISDVIKKAIDKAKGLVNDRENDKGEESVFSCDGDCDYADLTGNADIGYQLSIAMKLLEYDGDQKHFASTDERYRTTIEHFITELVAYRSRGHKNTPLRVKYVTVEDKVITKLMYAYFPKDEPSHEVECPSCVAMLDADAD